MGFGTRDTSGLEKQRFAERRSGELNELSPDQKARIGQPVGGKVKLSKVKKHKLVAKAAQRIASEPHKVTSTIEERAAFYQSWEWRTLRMLTLRRHGRRCQCCGATPQHLTLGGEPVRLVVDHIKPLGTHWHLRMDPENTQVLCDDCNMGKGGRYIADFRGDRA